MSFKAEYYTIVSRHVTDCILTNIYMFCIGLTILTRKEIQCLPYGGSLTYISSPFHEKSRETKDVELTGFSSSLEWEGGPLIVCVLFSFKLQLL